MEIICNTPETSSLSSQLRLNGRKIFDSHQVIIKKQKRDGGIMVRYTTVSSKLDSSN